jgi:hypothetical protein
MTKIVNTGVMKTRPSQQNTTNIFPWNNSERSNAPSAATAEGLKFSDPIHKKGARNLNLYDFCHSPKKTGSGIYVPLDGVTHRGLVPAFCHLNRHKASIHLDARFMAILKTSQSHLRAAIFSRNNWFFTTQRCVTPSSAWWRLLSQQIFI